MSKAYVPVALRRQVIADFEECCGFCGNPERLMDGIYQIDHIRPEARGGKTERDNLCFTCSLCNVYKGARTTAIDPQTGQRVNIYHPRLQKWSRHFAWSSDNLTILGRTRSGRATIAALNMNEARHIRLRRLWLRLDAKPPYWELEEV